MFSEFETMWVILHEKWRYLRNFHVISTLISSREKHAVSLSFSDSVFHMFLVNTGITWNVANAVLDLSKKISITLSLTPEKLHNSVNELKKKLELKFTWTNHDRIYFKQEKNTKTSMHARGF